MTLGKAWRRWLAALAVSLGAHLVLLSALLMHNEARTMSAPTVTIELLPMPEPRRPVRTADQKLRRPPAETPPPPASTDRAVLREIQPMQTAPPARRFAPAPPRATPGPEPLYSERPAPRRRSCWEGRLSEAEKIGCPQLALRDDKRFDRAESETFNGPLATAEQAAAYTAEPKPPLRLESDGDSTIIWFDVFRKKF